LEIVERLGPDRLGEILGLLKINEPVAARLINELRTLEKEEMESLLHRPGEAEARRVIEAKKDVCRARLSAIWERLRRAYAAAAEVPEFHISIWRPLTDFTYQPFPAAALLNSKHLAPPLSPSIIEAFSEPIRFTTK
jgi:hypothetical protein